MADCLRRDEAPIASHSMYTQPGVLDDTKPGERRKGMLAGWAWHECADEIVVYTDLGVTPGMHEGIAHAAGMGTPVINRKGGAKWRRQVTAARSASPSAASAPPSGEPLGRAAGAMRRRSRSSSSS
jgi:hypothetical protein